MIIREIASGQFENFNSSKSWQIVHLASILFILGEFFSQTAILCICETVTVDHCPPNTHQCPTNQCPTHQCPTNTPKSHQWHQCPTNTHQKKQQLHFNSETIPSLAWINFHKGGLISIPVPNSSLIGFNGWFYSFLVTALLDFFQTLLVLFLSLLLLFLFFLTRIELC